jgi:cytochrome oxidase assembly protein ShyY1
MRLFGRVVLLLAIGIVVTAVCVRAAIWQMDRLHDRRAFNEQVREGLGAEPVEVTTLLGREGAEAAPTYRAVRARGTYDPTDEVLVYGRSLNERPGYGVLTPLLLEDGGAVLIERGWVPSTERTAPVAVAAPPAGPVQVEGFTVPIDQGGTVSGDIVRGIDPGALEAKMGRPLLSTAIRLQDQEPPQPADLPAPLPPPELDEGPHLNYVFQWSIFATIALIGTAILIRRELREPVAIVRDAEDEEGGNG